MGDTMQMIQDIELAVEADDINLSEWEDGFIQDMKRLVEGGRELSVTQDEKLVEIWTKATR